MAILPIRTFGDPVLRTPAALVTAPDGSLEKLVEDMLDTMYDAPGVGLAAPQIGVSKRVFVADVGDGPFAMVNPKIVESAGSWSWDEGCLSVPGKFWSIERPAQVTAIGTDLDGDEIEVAGDELLGRVLQHEIDHLDGVLLLQRLPKRTRQQAMRELRNEALGVSRRE